MRRIQRRLADTNNKNFIGIHRLDLPHPRHTFDIVANKPRIAERT
jgi:hypothetical protein